MVTIHKIIKIKYTVCDTRSDPFGIILHPTTHEAQEFLKELLVKIGSNKRLGQHSEVEIG